jgi:hypothetical protein
VFTVYFAGHDPPQGVPGAREGACRPQEEDRNHDRPGQAALLKRRRRRDHQEGKLDHKRRERGRGKVEGEDACRSEVLATVSAYLNATLLLLSLSLSFILIGFKASMLLTMHVGSQQANLGDELPTNGWGLYQLLF